MDTKFYEQVSELDLCKTTVSPSKAQIEYVVSMIAEEKYNRYFFYGLENPSWVEPLYLAGVFHDIREPAEVEKGSYLIPSWDAGSYLIKFSDKYEDIVVELANKIKTKNWRVQELLIEGLTKIDPRKSINAIRCIDSWLDGPFSQMLPEKIRKLADIFIERDLIHGAITLLGFVIKPVLSKEYENHSRYKSPLVFRSDHYWVSEYCDKQLSILIEKAPLQVLELLSNHLETAIELIKKDKETDAEEYVGFLWRFDIPFRTYDSKDADVVDILIDGLRDGLMEVCKVSILEGRKLLSEYLSGEHIIFQRVALFVLRKFGKNYRELLDSALLNFEYLNLKEYSNEYKGLLRDQFPNANEKIKKQVVQYFINGPSDLREIAENAAKWENEEVTEKYIQRIKEIWTRDHLELIRDYLGKESLRLLDELSDKYGKADVIKKPHISSVHWERIPSPISVDDLASKSFQELSHYIKTYEPKEGYLGSRRSLGETLKIIVRDNTDKYSELAPQLKDKDIRFIYTYYFISGILESFENNNKKISQLIVDLCEYVASQTIDPFIESSDETEMGLDAAQREVARLFENALRTDDPYMDAEMLLIIRESLIKLSGHSDPKNEKYGENSFDPYTRSLNCVRGQAMHGLIQYMLYVYRKDKKLNTTTFKEGIFDSEIQKVFDEKLDKDKDPSLAVHSVFGAYIPQIQLLSPEWLEKNLEKIFPVDDKKSKYWDAAWDAYILTSNLFKNVFKLLLPQYKKAVLRLSSDKEKTNIGSSPDERLAQHLMLAYLNDLTGLGHENELFDLFFKNAPDNIRSSGIFWFYENLKTEGVKEEDPKWKKLWSLWNKRLNDAEAEEISKNMEEMSCYLRWLPYCPVGYKDLVPLIKKSIRYLHDAYDSKQLIEFVAKNCDENPLGSMEILRDVIFLGKEPWWNPKDEDEEKILRNAIASGIEEAKKLAYEVINFRGESGDFRWKVLLDI
jgi:hypothetical protein